MKIYNDQYLNGLFKLNNEDYLGNQRIAGKITAKALKVLINCVKEKTKKTLIELDKLAESIIIDCGAVPTFKGYMGYPASVCISVNNQLVHGIPSEYVLREGDLVTFDIGVTYNKSIADCAVTCIYGTSKYTDLVETTKNALTNAINSVCVDKKIGCIGDAIYKYVGGKYNIITNYGGHCINYDLHALPFISNKSYPSQGIRIQPGMVIAIEPMLTVGLDHTWVDSDGWTVYTKEASAHFEHSIYIHEDKIEIITDLDHED